MRKYIPIFTLVLLLSLSLVSASAYSSNILPDSSVTVNTFTGNLTNLYQLNDTNIPAPSNDEVLTYDGNNSKWISKSISSIMNFIMGIDSLNNDNDLFILNGSNYIGYDSAVLNNIIQTAGDLLYYPINNPNSYYNSTTLTTNSQLANGNNYWNDTHASFNQTYADTIYAPIGATGNPFDQSLNTTENVTFANVTANTYFGDGRFITNIDVDALNLSETNYWTKTGSELFYAGGEIGIGTADIVDLLTVATASSPRIGIYDTDGGGTASTDVGIVFGRRPNSPVQYAELKFYNKDLYLSHQASEGDLFFQTNSSTKMTILNDGNVGIGTGSPVYPLEVIGEIKGTVLTSLGNGNVQGRLNLIRNDGAVLDDNLLGEIDFKSMDTDWTSSQTAGGINMYAVGDQTGTSPKADMTFLTSNEATSIERMRINHLGNVGIGTGSPGQKVEIKGSSSSLSNGLLRLTDTTALDADVGGRMVFSGYYTGTTAISSWASIAGLKENNVDGEYGGYLSFSTRDHGSSIAESMRIDSSGNVGIGTTTPNQELHVEGNANITGTVYYGSLQANSPILYFTDDDFTVEIKKAINGTYYLEYVNENLTTEREWVNCNTATTWYQTEACAKLETTTLRHEMENNETNTYVTPTFQNITYYNNVSSEVEVCNEVLINESWEEEIFNNQTNETEFIFHESIYETQCNNETIYNQVPYEVEEIVNTTSKLTPYEYIYNWITNTAQTILEIFYNNLNEWEVGTTYSIGDIVEYEGIAYSVLQGHTSQSTWTPDTAHSLYASKFYTEQNSQVIEEWTQPTGASDCYDIGEIVTHDGSTWENIVNCNVWEPGVYGWEEQGV